LIVVLTILTFRCQSSV